MPVQYWELIQYVRLLIEKENRMKYFLTSIIFIIWTAIALGVGYWYRSRNPEIKIVKETETRFKYIKKATTHDEYRQCYKYKLGISTTLLKNNWIQIVATDKCKKAEKMIQVIPKIKRNYVYFNLGIKFYQVTYYRKVFNNVMIGGGVSYPPNIFVGVGYNF